MKRKGVYIIGVLIVSGLLLFFNKVFLSKEGSVAVVSINGETVGCYNLDIDGEFVLNGGTNTLVIDDGKAFMIQADCADKLCMKQGSISKSGQCIICLPNKLIVQIKETDATDQIYDLRL